MRNKIVALLGTLALVFGFNVATAQTASAAWGTVVTHAADDSGYARAIHVVCNTGKHVYLQRGQTTFLGTTEAESCSLSGLDRIIVAYNQTVYCKNQAYPYQNRYFYTGTTYFGSNQTWKCYDQWPL